MKLDATVHLAHTHSENRPRKNQQYRVDLSDAYDLAIALDFDGVQPRWFCAPQAHSTPLLSGAFVGRVASGASCNCSTVTLTPHCDGTHTECVGHLTTDRLDVRTVVPKGLLSALLLSVTPTAAAGTDGLITRGALSAAWPDPLAFEPRALVVRTRPNPVSKRSRDYLREPAPYLSVAAAELLVERGIEHLVLDVPSADRPDDAGCLSVHREFFGLPTGSVALADARRAHCTITELAYIDDAIADGAYLLSLHIPAFGGDAVPSRPMLYRIEPE